MVTKEDIKNLADLARIEVTPLEAEVLTGEIDSILGYVGSIQSVTADLKNVVPKVRNVLREDEVTNTPTQYTEDLLSNAPSREGEYLKVKKILG